MGLRVGAFSVGVGYHGPLWELPSGTSHVVIPARVRNAPSWLVSPLVRALHLWSAAVLRLGGLRTIGTTRFLVSCRRVYPLSPRTRRHEWVVTVVGPVMVGVASRLMGLVGVTFVGLGFSSWRAAVCTPGVGVCGESFGAFFDA